ncbi:carboxypeptidase-like regulatory domain-containing protein, partial [Chitinophaga sp.]|uniref:carboxypeptidase-like regulatory domain-containing protein n=1 Tax=Chitinophaga sp. TaxID=1869181 RepID=UPI0026265624
MRKLSTLLAVPILLSASAFAQDRTISGKVTDARDGNPLPGVTVAAGSRGTLTASNGQFSMKVPQGTRQLTFSFIGYTAQTVTLGEGNEYNVQLSVNQESLDEYVVVAYGSQNRRSMTGSAAIVNTEKLSRAPRASIQESFQGNIAGVQAVNGSGQPGSVPNIRIRGIGSINASSAPLYVVDGIPVVSGDITGYNTNTIAGLNSS